MFSRFFHVKHVSCLWLNNSPLYGYTTLCSNVNGHVGCFLLLTTVNSAAVDKHVQGLRPDFNSFGYIPRSGDAGSHCIPVFCEAFCSSESRRDIWYVLVVPYHLQT